MNVVLSQIDAQLAAATAGEQLGGRMPEDAFAVRDAPVFAYGVQDGRLYVASSAEAVAGIGAPGPSLGESRSLEAIRKAVGGEALLLFGDVTTMEEIGLLDPGTLPLAEGERLAFGMAVTQESSAVGVRMVLAIVE